MKHAKLFIAIAALILLTSGFLYSQDMMPPKPLENEFFDAMVGNSSGENLINGKIHKENVEIKWDINHQFIVINYSSQNKDNAEDIYQGLGIYGIDASGKVKTWWFDVWGAGNASAGEGTISGDKMQITENSPFYHSDNTYEFRDKMMIVTRKGHYKTQDGKEIPFEDVSKFTRNK